MSRLVGNWDDFGMDAMSSGGSLDVRLKATRDTGFSQVMLSARDIASYPDGSSELLALNRQILAYLTSRRRALTVWHTSPPGFGQRRLEATWIEHLELLDQEPAERRSLDWQASWPRLEAEIESGTNIWRGIEANPPAHQFNQTLGY